MGIYEDLASRARALGPLGGPAASVITLWGRTAEEAERFALSLLRSRMDAVAPSEPSPRRASSQEPDPAEMLERLLARSLEQDTDASRRELQVAALRQLVPDEARILAALADGPPAPLVHIAPRAGGGRLLENASLIGRMAAVTLPSMTPVYVSHLRQLGLVETGPEDPDNEQGYELLMADKDVRDALKEGELSKLPGRTFRRTLRLSDRGRALWEASRP